MKLSDSLNFFLNNTYLTNIILVLHTHTLTLHVTFFGFVILMLIKTKKTNNKNPQRCEGNSFDTSHSRLTSLHEIFGFVVFMLLKKKRERDGKANTKVRYKNYHVK